MSTADSSSTAARQSVRKRHARLARAVLLADRGDNVAALALAKEVLAEDAQSLPARALLDRLEGTRPRGTSQPEPRPPERGSWAQFEHRMRLRREATCATAMRQALDAGDYTTALARARELAEIDAVWDEVRLLLEAEAGVAERRIPRISAAVPEIAPQVRRTTGSAGRLSRLTAAIALLLAIVATAGWLAVRLLRPTPIIEQPARRAVALPSAEVEVPNLPLIGAPAASAEPAAGPPPTLASQPSSPAPVSMQAASDARPDKEKSVADARQRETAPIPSPLSQQYNVRVPATPPSSQQPPLQPPAPSTAVPVEPASIGLQTLPLTPTPPEAAPPSPPARSTAVERAPLTAAPAVRDARPAGTTGTTTPSPVSAEGRPSSAEAGSPSSNDAAAAVADDRRGVSATLAAYQLGYTSLDASAVSRVWPRVDAQALQAAFGQLESQRIAFSGCSIDVRGLHATATCRGKATYVPKVGSGEAVTMQHTWQFALRRFGESWVIDTATTR